MEISHDTNVLQRINERLQVLENENRVLRLQSRTAPSEPRVSLPDKFDGNRRKFRGFLNQVELLFMLNPNCYQSDPSRVGLIGTLLTDKALTWFSPILERNDPILDDYPSFRKALIQTFEEPDKAVIAASKITRLFQGNSPVFSYASEFRLLAASLDWNDAALIHQFRIGLNNDVKDLLLHHETPASLDSMINLAILIDNRLYEHHQDKRLTYRVPTLRPQNQHQDYTSEHPSYAPMEINAISRSRHITPAEKERRRTYNLCLYCGSADHIRKDCNLAPSPRKVSPSHDNHLKARSH